MLHRNKVTSAVPPSAGSRSASTVDGYAGPVDAADVVGAVPGQILPDWKSDMTGTATEKARACRVSGWDGVARATAAGCSD